MSDLPTEALGLNFGSAAVLNALTTPGGISYVLAYDTTNTYLRFFDGVTTGGKRLAWFTDISAAITALNLGTASTANTTAFDPAGAAAAVLATVPAAAASAPLVNGSASAGSSASYARGDHVHPNDTSRLAVTNNLSELSATAGTARLNLSPAKPVSGSYAIAAADYTLLANTSSAPVTLLLPASPTIGMEFRVVDHKRNAGTNNITISGQSGATIAGQASYTIQLSGAAVGFLWNGTEWSVV